MSETPAEITKKDFRNTDTRENQRTAVKKFQRLRRCLPVVPAVAAVVGGFGVAHHYDTEAEQQRAAIVRPESLVVKQDQVDKSFHHAAVAITDILPTVQVTGGANLSDVLEGIEQSKSQRDHIMTSVRRNEEGNVTVVSSLNVTKPVDPNVVTGDAELILTEQYHKQVSKASGSDGTIDNSFRNVSIYFQMGGDPTRPQIGRDGDLNLTPEQRAVIVSTIMGKHVAIADQGEGNGTQGEVYADEMGPALQIDEQGRVEARIGGENVTVEEFPNPDEMAAASTDKEKAAQALLAPDTTRQKQLLDAITSPDFQKQINAKMDERANIPAAGHDLALELYKNPV